MDANRTMTSTLSVSGLSVTVFFEEQSHTCQYVVGDPTSKTCVIVDPVLDFDLASGQTKSTTVDALTAFVQEQGWTVTWILETHCHADHLSGSQRLKTSWPSAQVGIGEHIQVVQKVFSPIYDLRIATDGSQFDRLFAQGDSVDLGPFSISVLHTPGHTPACVTYVVSNKDTAIAAFVGDTLFAPDAGTGRCDFPHGSAHDMWHSLQKILALPDDVRIFLCHDYQPGGRELVFSSTVKEQRESNIHLAESDEEKYKTFRTTRDAKLSFPRLLLPSIQTNIDGGHLPKPRDGEKNAHLRIPLNFDWTKAAP